MSDASTVIFVGSGPLDRVPVFHALQWSSNADERATTTRRWWRTDTNCGITLTAAQWDADDRDSYRVTERLSLRFRLDHARAIGRPCRRCYPKGIE